MSYQVDQVVIAKSQKIKFLFCRRSTVELLNDTIVERKVFIVCQQYILRGLSILSNYIHVALC